MKSWLLIALGSAAGGVSRHAVSLYTARWIGEHFPFGTLLVNLSGCFIIGLFATLTDPSGRWMVSPHGRLFFMTGFLGGYTTFSSFSLQTLALARDGQWLYASANILFSVAGCLLAVWLGSTTAHFIQSVR